MIPNLSVLPELPDCYNGDEVLIPLYFNENKSEVLKIIISNKMTVNDIFNEYTNEIKTKISKNDFINTGRKSISSKPKYTFAIIKDGDKFCRLKLNSFDKPFPYLFTGKNISTKENKGISEINNIKYNLYYLPCIKRKLKYDHLKDNINNENLLKKSIRVNSILQRNNSNISNNSKDDLNNKNNLNNKIEIPSKERLKEGHLFNYSFINNRFERIKIQMDRTKLIFRRSNWDKLKEFFKIGSKHSHKQGQDKDQIAYNFQKEVNNSNKSLSNDKDNEWRTIKFYDVDQVVKGTTNKKIISEESEANIKKVMFEFSMLNKEKIIFKAMCLEDRQEWYDIIAKYLKEIKYDKMIEIYQDKINLNIYRRRLNSNKFVASLGNVKDLLAVDLFRNLFFKKFLSHQKELKFIFDKIIEYKTTLKNYNYPKAFLCFMVLCDNYIINLESSNNENNNNNNNNNNSLIINKNFIIDKKYIQKIFDDENIKQYKDKLSDLYKELKEKYSLSEITLNNKDRNSSCILQGKLDQNLFDNIYNILVSRLLKNAYLYLTKKDKNFVHFLQNLLNYFYLKSYSFSFDNMIYFNKNIKNI